MNSIMDVGRTVSPTALWIVNPDTCGRGRFQRMLEREGLTVAVYGDCHAWADAAAGKPGLVLLDWACLPRPKPRSLAALKTRLPGVAVAITSAVSLSNPELIELFESGADEYFPPSLDSRLMLAMLRAHLRRIGPAAARPDVVLSPRSDVRLDRARREVAVFSPRGGWERRDLTPTEFHILGLLLEAAGEVLERTCILESIKGGLGEAVLPGTVDKHVEALRRKMGCMGARIRTVYGVGYAWREEDRT